MRKNTLVLALAGIALTGCGWFDDDDDDDDKPEIINERPSYLGTITQKPTTASATIC